MFYLWKKKLNSWSSPGTCSSWLPFPGVDARGPYLGWINGMMDSWMIRWLDDHLASNFTTWGSPLSSAYGDVTGRILVASSPVVTIGPPNHPRTTLQLSWRRRQQQNRTKIQITIKETKIIVVDNQTSKFKVLSQYLAMIIFIFVMILTVVMHISDALY